MEHIKQGDHILFNDRKQPLEVVKAGAEKLLVEGPQGGEYVIFPAEDDPDLLLVAKPGQRQYASTVEDLRVVGHWERKSEETWKHSGTGARIQLVENDAGNWTLDVDGIDATGLPMYGFLAKEDAIEEAENLVRKNPEG